MAVLAWHVRLKQYYPTNSEGIKHSRVVTGLTTQQLYKEKSLPGAVMSPRKHEASRKRKNSKSDKDKEKKRVRADSEQDLTDSKVEEFHGEHNIENGHSNNPEKQVNNASQFLEPIVFLNRDLSEDKSVKTTEEISTERITSIDDKNQTKYLHENIDDRVPESEIKVDPDTAEIKEETL